MSSPALRPSPVDIQAQIAEARKWLYPGATEYLAARHRAIVEVLERVLREGFSDEELHRLSYDFHREEQVALGNGNHTQAVAPGAKHEALEWIRGRADEPVEEF